jgi:hypothetical protein
MLFPYSLDWKTAFASLSPELFFSHPCSHRNADGWAWLVDETSKQRIRVTRPKETLD